MMSNNQRGQGRGQRRGQGRGQRRGQGRGHHHGHHQGQIYATYDNDVDALNAQIQDLRLSSSTRSRGHHRRPQRSQRGEHVGHQHTDRYHDVQRVPAAGQQFRCLSCNQFAFQASHLFMLSRSQHGVLDPDLFKRVLGRPHPDPGEYDDGFRTWSKVNKFNCTCCGRDWGITSRSADVVIPVVKIVNFNIIDENGNSKFYDKWVKVPIQFQRSNRYRESTYMTEVTDLQFTSTFDINERITSDGAVVAISGLELTVPADAVPTGTQYDLLGDSVVFCSTLDEFTNTGDVLIAPSIQFEPCEDVREFKKNVLLKIKHIARNKNEVTVYKSDHKNADDFDEIERNEERDDVDLDEAEHFTIDEDFIYIHTKSLRLFCFVESNRRISFSDDVTISVHSRVLSCLVELRVFAYDNAILHERHLQRFKDSLRMSGYHLEAERQVTLTGPLCEEDTLDVEATPRNRTLCDSTGEFMEHQRVFRKLFCVDSTKVAGETIVFPQEFASFVLNSNSQDCRFTKRLEANLRIKHKSSNAGLTTEVDSIDVQIDLE